MRGIVVVLAMEIYSESELSGSLRRSLIICVLCQRSACCAAQRDAYAVEPSLELVDLRLFDQDVLLVQFFDDVFVVVLAIDVDQHGLDGRVASHEGTWPNEHGAREDRRAHSPLIALTIVYVRKAGCRRICKVGLDNRVLLNEARVAPCTPLLGASTTSARVRAKLSAMIRRSHKHHKPIMTFGFDNVSLLFTCAFVMLHERLQLPFCFD